MVQYREDYRYDFRESLNLAHRALAAAEILARPAALIFLRPFPAGLAARVPFLTFAQRARWAAAILARPAGDMPRVLLFSPGSIEASSCFNSSICSRRASAWRNCAVLRFWIMRTGRQKHAGQSRFDAIGNGFARARRSRPLSELARRLGDGDHVAEHDPNRPEDVLKVDADVTGSAGMMRRIVPVTWSIGRSGWAWYGSWWGCDGAREQRGAGCGDGLGSATVCVLNCDDRWCQRKEKESSDAHGAWRGLTFVQQTRPVSPV